MPMIFALSCENGHTGTVSLPWEGQSFTQSGGEMSHASPCPLCGGKMTAPSGHYEKGPDDLMVLIDLSPKALN